MPITRTCFDLRHEECNGRLRGIFWRFSPMRLLDSPTQKAVRSLPTGDQCLCPCHTPIRPQDWNWAVPQMDTYTGINMTNPYDGTNAREKDGMTNAP